MAHEAHGDGSILHKSSWIPLSSDFHSSGKHCQQGSNDRKTDTSEEQDRKLEACPLTRTDPKDQKEPCAVDASNTSKEPSHGQDVTITYESVLTSVGEFGRYQKFVCLVLCMTHTNMAVQLIGSVFTLAVPEHRCAIPGLANDTWQTQNDHHAILVDAFVPPADLHTRSSCYLFSDVSEHLRGNWSFYGRDWRSARWSGHLSDSGTDDTVSHQPSSGTAANGTVTCSRYVYDTSTYASSVSMELGLVCERNLRRSHAQMMLMLGCLVGSQLSGLLADIWGRKISLKIFLVLNVISAFSMAFVQHYVMLLAVMFATGVSALGIICPAFVLKMEIVGPSKRLWPGVGISAFFAVGEMVLSVLAYFFRDWQHLQLACASLTLPYLAYWWLIPESPRWLLSKGRVAEAEVILTRLARANKATFNPSVLERLTVNTDAQKSLWRVFFSATQLTGRYLIIFLAWCLASMTYYGLSLNAGTLGGSAYVNVAMMGMVELVGFALCVLLLERVGRRLLCSGMFLVAGLACTSTLFPVLFAAPDKQWITTMLALIGKCGIAGAFAITWLYSSELFPTVIRNSSMGASSLFARVGGIVAPYIANLDEGGEGGKAIPLIIFGVPSIVVCMLLFCLPETLRRRMPETVQDAIDMGRKRQDNTIEIVCA